MKIDIRPRGGGKTIKAVNWVKAGRVNNKLGTGNRMLVVFSEAEKLRVMNGFGLDRHEVESADALLNHVSGSHRSMAKKLYLDNADIFLHSVFGSLLHGVSLTKWEDSEKVPKFSAKEVRKDRRAMRKVLKKKPGL